MIHIIVMAGLDQATRAFPNRSAVADAWMPGSGPRLSGSENSVVSGQPNAPKSLRPGLTRPSTPFVGQAVSVSKTWMPGSSPGKACSSCKKGMILHLAWPRLLNRTAVIGSGHDELVGIVHHLNASKHQ